MFPDDPHDLICDAGLKWSKSRLVLVYKP